jgi:glycosyltransferase involved in cell wall biosynthesis
LSLVAHLASYGNPQPSSFIPCILRLSEALEARGDHLALITLDIPKATWIDQVRRAISQLHLVSTATEACAILASLRPSIVHTHFDDFDVPATLKLLRTGARIFWHDHSLRTQGFLSGLRFYAKYLGVGKRAEAFIACSQTTAADLRNWGAPSGKIKVVVNGIDLNRFRAPFPEERRSARDQFGLNGEDVLLFFARDIFIKGVDIFCNALALLNNPTVILVGAPAEAREQIARLSSRLIVIESITDVRRLYWAADLLVMPSRHEGLPQVLIEGLASGLPAIASDIPAVREITTGLGGTQLIAVGDHRALAEAIAYGDRKPVSGSPVLKKFALERWVRDVLDLYGYNSQVKALT